jgi:hypothetical protein
MASAGDGRADVGIGVLDYFLGFGREQFLDKIVAAGEVEFFGQDAERVFRSDKMHAGNALIGFERTQQFAAENRA